MNKQKTKQNKRSHTSTVAQIARNFRPSSDNNHIERVRLVAQTYVTSSAATIINQVYSMNPSGASEWTQYVALYDEFRVTAIRLSLIPMRQGSVTAVNDGVAIVYDNDDSVVLTSVNAALEYDTAYFFPAIWYANRAKPTSWMWARPTAGQATAIPWVDVAAPTGSNGSIKMYSTGLTASTVYFSGYLEFFVEFRGRR